MRQLHSRGPRGRKRSATIISVQAASAYAHCSLLSARALRPEDPRQHSLATDNRVSCTPLTLLHDDVVDIFPTSVVAAAPPKLPLCGNAS